MNAVPQAFHRKLAATPDPMASLVYEGLLPAYAHAEELAAAL